MPEQRRRFSPQFKAEAVQMVLETGKPIAEVARDLGINEGTLGNWLNLWRRDNPEPVPDLNPVERARVKEMEDEIRRLRMENEFLKKVVMPPLAAPGGDENRRWPGWPALVWPVDDAGTVRLDVAAAWCREPEKSMTWRSGAPGRAASSANFRLLDRQASAGRPRSVLAWGGAVMDQLVERCAGLDVHRDTVVATVRRPRPGGGRVSKTLTFSTTTAELTALGDWLVAEEVDLVGMESTGVYWKPVYFLLEQRIPQVWLLNAEHLHNVPGRKTDVADSAWIAQLLEHGLVAPSFVPSPPIRELRDLTRHRRVLIEERTRVIQRLEKVLQDAGIKLSSVVSTLLTKSGRAILDALLAGISDPGQLAELAKGRLRSKIPTLREALAGEFQVAHHGILVAQMLAHVDFLEDCLADLDARIEGAAIDYELVLQRVVTIPGVARKTAISLL